MAAPQGERLFLPQREGGKEDAQRRPVRRLQAVGNFHEQGKCQRRIAQQAGDHGGRFLAAGQIRRDRWLDFVPEFQGAACRSLGLQTHRNSHGEHEGAHRRQDKGDIERDAQKTGT